MVIQPVLGGRIPRKNRFKKTPKLLAMTAVHQMGEFMRHHIFEHRAWSENQVPVDEDVGVLPA